MILFSVHACVHASEQASERQSGRDRLFICPCLPGQSAPVIMSTPVTGLNVKELIQRKKVSFKDVDERIPLLKEALDKSGYAMVAMEVLCFDPFRLLYNKEG